MGYEIACIVLYIQLSLVAGSLFRRPYAEMTAIEKVLEGLNFGFFEESEEDSDR